MKILSVIFTTIVFFQLLSIKVSGQDNSKIDSMLNVLKTAKADTNQAKTLFSLTWESLKSQETKEARVYANQAMELCRQLNFERGIATVNYYFGLMDRLDGNYESAISFFDKSLKYRIAQMDTMRMAYIYYQLAVIYQRQSKFETSLELYLKTLDVYEKKQMDYGIADVLNGIGIIYKNLNQYEKALEHYSQAIEIFRRLGSVSNITYCLNNMANVYSEQKEFESALKLYNEALELNIKDNNQMKIAYQYANIGILYIESDKLDKAKDFLTRALEIRKRNGQKKELAETYASFGQLYLKQNELAKSVESLNLSLDLATEIGAGKEIKIALENLAETYAKMGDFKQAFLYHKEYENVKDSLFNSEKAKIIYDLQTKYETEHKENEIARIKSQQQIQEAKLKQEKNEKIFLATGVFFLLVLIGILIFYFKQRIKNNRLLTEKNDEINRRKLKEMEKNQKLYALDAMISGQEAERKRIARDLHDGLGVLLSNVQMHFNAINENGIKVEGNKRYKTANRLLNEASDEVRKIAHNMMPGTLLKLGLVPALKDLCDHIDQNTTIHTQFHSFDLDERFSENIEVSSYRLVQEILNNVLKHSFASELLVQISRNDDGLNITVEDNGIGFNLSEAKKNGGMGLKNLESRVKYLNGEIQIHSREGKGTTITIDIPVAFSVMKNAKV